MRDRSEHWEGTFEKLCILRDACNDPQVALYLVAGMSDDKLSEVITATREFEAGVKPAHDLQIVHTPRN